MVSFDFYGQKYLVIAEQERGARIFDIQSAHNINNRISYKQPGTTYDIISFKIEGINYIALSLGLNGISIISLT